MIIYSLPVLRKLVIVAQSNLARRTRGFRFEKGLCVHGWPILRCVKGAKVTAGRNLVLISHSVFSAPGVARPCLINAMAPGARIVIGHDVGMSGASICSRASITIGDRVLLGADVMIVDTDFHPVQSVPRRYAQTGIGVAPVVIEDDVFIGMRAMVLKGTRIGKGSVVGAGAVVTSDVPPFSIVAGQPARVVGAVDAGR